MIQKIKVKKPELEVKETEEVSINDDNLAKKEGPNGEKVEANKNFILYYGSNIPSSLTSRKYVESKDGYFNPSKIYYMESRSGEKVKSFPIRLNLYEFNGNNYVLSNDKEFKDKEYFLDEDGEENATPETCDLYEDNPELKKYSNYSLFYKPNDGSAQKRILSMPADYEANWNKIKQIYEGCVNNADLLNNVYEEKGVLGIKNSIENDFEDVLEEHRTNVLLKRQRVGAKNSLNRTANMTSQLYNNEAYKAQMERDFLAETGKTVEDYIKEISNGNMSKEEINNCGKIAGRTIRYEHGKYNVTAPKVDGKFLFKKSNGSTMYSNSYKTLKEALDGIVIANTIAGNLRANIKGKTAPEEINKLVEEANTALLEQLNENGAINDSYKYITYEIKDDKKIITGYYKTLEDAENAEEEKKLVKLNPGIYFNESTKKYVAIPQTEYDEEELNSDKLYKIIRLGEFDTEAEATKAVQTLARLSYNIEDFFNSKFYKEHLEECQEARDYYFEENNEIKRNYGIEKQGKSYRIWYYNPTTKKTEHFGSYANEYQAEAILQQVDHSELSPTEFFTKLKEENADFIGEHGENLKELKKKGIKEIPLTTADLENLINSVDISSLSIDEIKKLLSGDFAGNAGMISIYKNVINYLKKRLGYNKDDIDYNVVLTFQNRLMLKLTKYAINKFIEFVNTNPITFNDEDEFIDQGLSFIAKEFGGNIDYIMTPNDIRRVKKQLKKIYSEI